MLNYYAVKIYSSKSWTISSEVKGINETEMWICRMMMIIKWTQYYVTRKVEGNCKQNGRFYIGKLMRKYGCDNLTLTEHSDYNEKNKRSAQACLI